MIKTITFKKIILISLCSLFTVFTVNAQFSGGSGTDTEPYEIATFEDLQFLSENPGYWSNHFIQTADIDASITETLNGGAGFSPIGSFNGTAFSGSYDGQGFLIQNLTINRPSENSVGLFGYTYFATGDIKRIGLVGGSITGQNNVGALVGRNSIGNFGIEECFAAVDITCQGSGGGLIGEAYTPVTNCYAMGTVTGQYHVGGLIGRAEASVTNCYSIGNVTALDDMMSYAGGLIGELGLGSMDPIVITNSYYDSQTSGQNDNWGKGEPKTTAEMKTQGTFTGWNFNDIWEISPECPNNGYPYFQWQLAGPLPTITSTTPDSRVQEGEVTLSAESSEGFVNWYDAQEDGNLLYTGLNLTTTVSQTTSFWAEPQVNVCVGERVEVIATVFPCIEINESLNIVASETQVCEGESASITIENTQDDISYFLREEEQIIDGPLVGNGGDLTFTLNNLTETKTYNVFAESESAVHVTSNALRFTGNAGQKKVSLGTTLWDEAFAGTDQLTVEAWVNKSETGSLHTVMSNYEGAYPFLFRIDNEQINIFLNSSLVIQSNATIPINTWTHVAATYNGTTATVSIYINGVLDNDNSGNFFGTLASSDNELKIGGGLSNGTEYFPGDITEVRMWNIARTAGEIADSYDTQLTGNEPGLVVYYQFNEGSGTTANNAAANGLYDGTLINDPEWITDEDMLANCSFQFPEIIEVTVNEAVEADILNDVEACGEYVLADLTTGGYYTETNGGGNLLNATDAITESQTLFIFAENGLCSDESSFTITIDETVEADVLDDVNQCAGEFVLPELTTGNYFTETNGGGDPLNATDVITESQMLFVFAENGLCSDESSFEVNIHAIPDATVTQSEITLTAVEAGLSYQWLDCDNSFAPITGETDQSFTAESNGNYAVEISNDECSEVSDCFTISTVSVHEASMNNSLTVYPNPGNGTFFIEFGEMTQADILVRDIAGRIVYRINNIATALHEFQLNGAAGVYLLEVNTPQKRQTFKLIKQ